MKVCLCRLAFVFTWVCLLSSSSTAEQPIKILQSDDAPSFMAFLNEGRRLLAVGRNNSWATIWDLSANTVKASFKTHWPARACAISPDQSTLATLGDGRVTLYDIGTTKRVNWIPYDGVPSFSPDGKTLAIASNGLRRIVLWDLSSSRDRSILVNVDRPVHCLGFGSSGKLLACAGEGSAICLWEVESGRQAGTLKGHPEAGRVDHIAFSTKEKVLASTAVRLGKDIAPAEVGLPNDAGAVLAIRENLGAEIRIWEPDSRKLLVTLPTRAMRINILEFSPSGRLLVAGFDKSVVVWNTFTWKQLKTFDHDDEVLSATVSPDEKHLAIGTWDKRIVIWKLAN